MSTPVRVGAARIAPGDRVVARDAAAPLQRRAERRGSAASGEMLSGGQNAFACSRRQPLVVDAVEPVGVDVALEGSARRARCAPASCTPRGEYMTL